jgi:hypothetical protein
MIAQEHTPLRASRSQMTQSRFDQLLADTTPLKRRLDGHRTKGEPPLERRRPDLRERDVANELFADHGHERQGKRPGFAQRVDHAGLRPVAEREPGKRACGQRPNGVVVGGRFRSYQNGRARRVSHATGPGRSPDGAQARDVTRQ